MITLQNDKMFFSEVVKPDEPTVVKPGELFSKLNCKSEGIFY